MNRRILHFSQTDIRTDSRILKELKALANFGYDVLGIGVSADEGTLHDSNAGNLKIITVPLYSKKLVFFPNIIIHALCMIEMIFRMYLQGRKHRPHIVHCHDTLALPLGAIFKLLNKTKLIYDAHELESNKNGTTKIESFVTLCVEKLLWGLVDALIVVSPSIEKWYHQNIGPKLSEVILNAPEVIKNEDVGGNYLRNFFKIPDSSQIFIYVGILNHGRGIEQIIESFVADKKAHVVFLGYGSYAKKINQICNKYDNIHLHAAVEHTRVVDIIKSADFGLCLVENVSLSDYYCLPNKLFEYAFSGLPVLASNFPDIYEVVNKYKLGYCVDLSSDSIKNGIATLRNLESDSSEIFDNLYDLSWQFQSEKLVELYSKIN